MKLRLLVLAAMSAIFILAMSADYSAANPCNPCAKNACNPCAKKNACNPCAGNPCNPCGGDAKKFVRSEKITNMKKLLARGEKMWNDDTLGTSGLSCMTCHEDYELLNLDRHKGVWPHNIPGMTDDIYTLTQMINFCFMNPMKGKAIDPNGIDMTAMEAYYYKYIKGYKGGSSSKAKNACNPCGKKMRNACNPCGK